jgi:hypothetical protein
MFWRGQEVTRRRLEKRLAATNGRPTSAGTASILPGIGTLFPDCEKSPASADYIILRGRVARVCDLARSAKAFRRNPLD